MSTRLVQRTVSDSGIFCVYEWTLQCAIDSC